MSKPRSRVFTSHPFTSKALVGAIVSLIVAGSFCTLPTFPRAAASSDRAAKLVQRNDSFLNEVAGAKPDHDLLKMYSDFCAFTLKERKALFRNASSSQKSELWRTHLALFLDRPDLNERQKQIISTAMSLATAEFFEVPANTPAWKTKVRVPLRALENQILAAFSLEEGAKIFATLGDNTKVGRGPLTPGSVSLNRINYWRLRDSAVQDPPSGPPCECSTESDYCPITGYCGAANCSPTQSGCGTIWSYPCNGACR